MRIRGQSKETINDVCI